MPLRRTAVAPLQEFTMSSSTTLRSRMNVLTRLVSLATAAVLLVAAGASANAQVREDFGPIIAVPPVNHVTIAPTLTPTTTPTLAPAAPPSIGPAPVIDSSQSISRVVGSPPDPSTIMPNTRVMQQQSRGGDLNDNFLTED